MADPKPLISVCPGCGFFGPPEAFTLDDDNKLYNEQLRQIGNPELSRLVGHYIGLFRPRQRRLTAPRARKLLADLVPMIVAQRAAFDGRTYEAPAAAWQTSIEEMLAIRERLTLPLENHNYLLKIVIKRAPGIAAAAEQEIEQQRQRASQARGAQHEDGPSPLSQAVQVPMRHVETQEERMRRLRREAYEAEQRSRT